MPAPPAGAALDAGQRLGGIVPGGSSASSATFSDVRDSAEVQVGAEMRSIRRSRS